MVRDQLGLGFGVWVSWFGASWDWGLGCASQEPRTVWVFGASPGRVGQHAGGGEREAGGGGHDEGDGRPRWHRPDHGEGERVRAGVGCMS